MKRKSASTLTDWDYVFISCLVGMGSGLGLTPFFPRNSSTLENKIVSWVLLSVLTSMGMNVKCWHVCELLVPLSRPLRHASIALPRCHRRRQVCQAVGAVVIFQPGGTTPGKQHFELLKVKIISFLLFFGLVKYTTKN